MSKLQIPNYPEDFFSFKGGVPISDEQINKWIKDCIKSLEENLKSDHSDISSGNTRVDVSRYYLEGENYYYEVNVSKEYYNTDTLEK